MRAVVFWALLVPITGTAQQDAPQQAPVRPPFTLKTVPTNFINPVQQSIDVLADLPVSARWGIELGFGAVVNSLSLAPFDGETHRGLKLKPAVKYYFKPSATGHNYLALAFKYKDLRNSRHINVLRQGGQYSEWMFQRRLMETWGVGLRAGRQEYLGKHKRWLIEPYLGLGIRQLRISNKALPPDAMLLDDRRLFSTVRLPGIYTTPDVLMGCFLGWRIGSVR